MERRKHRKRRQPWSPVAPADRRASDLPMNARVAVVTVVDPYARPGDPSIEGSERARLQPARRRDGSIAPGAHEWVPPEQPLIDVIRSLRDDPLARLLAHRSIDQVQFDAGRHWQSLYERASVGSVQSVDTTKEPVDGGGMRDAMTDSQRQAVQKLANADAALGERGAWLVRAILGNGMHIKQVAAITGATTESAKAFWSAAFKKSLDQLAEEFGYASRRVEPTGRKPARRRNGDRKSRSGLHSTRQERIDGRALERNSGVDQ